MVVLPSVPTYIIICTYEYIYYVFIFFRFVNSRAIHYNIILKYLRDLNFVYRIERMKIINVN